MDSVLLKLIFLLIGEKEPSTQVLKKMKTTAEKMWIHWCWSTKLYRYSHFYFFYTFFSVVIKVFFTGITLSCVCYFSVYKNDYFEVLLIIFILLYSFLYILLIFLVKTILLNMGVLFIKIFLLFSDWSSETYGLWKILELIRNTIYIYSYFVPNVKIYLQEKINDSN